MTDSTIVTENSAAKRRWLRFSLRTLLIVVTVICVFLGRDAWLARRQAGAINAIHAMGGRLGFDYQFDAQNKWIRNPDPAGPSWLRQVVGPEYFQRAVIVNLDEGSDPTDEDVSVIRHLPHLRQLTLDNRPRVTDACLAHFSGLHDLQWLTLSRTQVTGEGLQHIGHLQKLEGLSMDRTPLTDEGLRHIQNLKSLKFLYLSNTKVTDQGLLHLCGLVNLEILELDGTTVSDEGLKHLDSLANLRRLSLSKTGTTAAGRAKLRQALPNLR